MSHSFPVQVFFWSSQVVHPYGMLGRGATAQISETLWSNSQLWDSPLWFHKNLHDTQIYFQISSCRFLSTLTNKKKVQAESTWKPVGKQRSGNHFFLRAILANSWGCGSRMVTKTFPVAKKMSFLLGMVYFFLGIHHECHENRKLLWKW